MTVLKFTTRSVEYKEQAYDLWWYTSVTVAPETLRQGDCKFKGILNNKAKPFLKGKPETAGG